MQSGTKSLHMIKTERVSWDWGEEGSLLARSIARIQTEEKKDCSLSKLSLD